MTRRGVETCPRVVARREGRFGLQYNRCHQHQVSGHSPSTRREKRGSSQRALGPLGGSQGDARSRPDRGPPLPVPCPSCRTKKKSYKIPLCPSTSVDSSLPKERIRFRKLQRKEQHHEIICRHDSTSADAETPTGARSRSDLPLHPGT